MKIFFSIVFSILLLSCNKATEESSSEIATIESDTVHIQGHIENYSLQDSINEPKFYVEHPFEGQLEYKTAIDSEGNYETTFPTYRKQSVGMVYKNWTQLIANGGDSLVMNFDGAPTDAKAVYKSAVVEGTGAPINKLLFDYLENDPFSADFYYDKYQTLEPAAFKKVHDSMYKVRKEYASSFLKSQAIDDDLRTFIEVDTTFSPKEKLIGYTLFNPKAKNSAYETILPTGFLNDVNKLPKIEEEMLINSTLISSFSNYYTYHLYGEIRAQHKNAAPELRDSLQLASLITLTKENKVLQQLVLNEHLRSRFANNDLEAYDKGSAQFDVIFKDSYAENLITQKVAAIRELLANPVLPKNTLIASFAANDPNAYLDEIIENAEGKVIFIDNWATWCGPCRSEFKNATPQLKEKFSKDVAFVYLCYQSKKEAWKPMISKYQIAGTHYFIESDEEKPLFDTVKLHGFPTYTIINKKGEIVHSNFEYRPSNPVTATILSELIAE